MQNQKITKKERTRQRIVDAFLHFYFLLPFEDITVKSITDELNINRGTFYLHYLNLDDLLTSVEDVHLQKIVTLNKENWRSYLSNDVNELKQYYTSSLRYIEKNMAEFRVLMAPQSRPRFRSMFKDIMKQNAAMQVTSLNRNLNRDLFNEHAVDIIVESNMSIISNWVAGESKKSAQDIADLFGDILLNLPYSNLRS